MAHNLSSCFIISPGIIAGAEKVVIEGLSALQAKNIKVHCVVIKESRVTHLADTFVKLLDERKISYKIKL